MFRSSDGAGVSRLHLCGLTPTPGQNAVAKISLGAEQAVPWVYYPATLQAAASLHENGFRLWALEGGSQVVSIFDMIPEAARPDARVALVCGNEVSGVDPQVLDLCEQRVAIPMAGIKDSLNVAVAFGIAVYLLRWAGRFQPEGSQNLPRITG